MASRVDHLYFLRRWSSRGDGRNFREATQLRFPEIDCESDILSQRGRGFSLAVAVKGRIVSGILEEKGTKYLWTKKKSYCGHVYVAIFLAKEVLPLSGWVVVEFGSSFGKEH